MKKIIFIGLSILCVATSYSQTITTIAGNGKSGFSGDGEKATNARLNLPVNLTIDKEQNIYIADTYNNSIRRIDANTKIITTVVRNEDKFAVSRLKNPTGVAIDEKDNLYIAELTNERIRRVNVNSGSEMTLVGKKTELEQPNINYDLQGPFNVVFDKDGNLYVSVTGDNKIRRVDFATGDIDDVAGTDEIGFSGDGGPAKNAQIMSPTGLVIDVDGNIYFSDSGNERIRRIDTSGVISTIIGNGKSGYSGDGGPAKNARVSNPMGLAIGKNSDLFFVDRGNNRIRKIELSSGIVSTVAGTGKSGYSGDGGLAKDAKLSNPTGIAFDKNYNLYIVDRGNNRIRMVSGLYN